MAPRSPARRRRPPRAAGVMSELPPLLIIRKMILLQCAYYLFAVILVIFTALVFGRPIGLDLLLDWRKIRGDTTVGFMMSIVWLAVAFFSVFPLLFLLPRSHLIPDFALTIHFIHLLAVSFYMKSIPTNLLWWALQGGSATLMIILGFWAARYRELRPMTFGIGGSGGKASGATERAGAGRSRPVDEEQGFVRGGRGRGRDRGGEPGYEMVEREDREEDSASV